MSPHEPLLYGLVGAKLFTNVLADLGLRRDRFALGGLNIAADMALLTGGIHLTGGPFSPLFVAYVIEICVLALLTNRGVTVLLASFAFVCHTTAMLLTRFGVLVQHPSPAATVEPFDGLQIALAIGFAAFVLGATTLFTTTLARELEDKRRALERRTQELVARPGVDGAVIFEVQDTGIGIPEHELPRIFEPFRQVTSVRLEAWGSGSRSCDGWWNCWVVCSRWRAGWWRAHSFG